MTRGTHALVSALKPTHLKHYREFMQAVHGHDINAVVRVVNAMTHMQWRGCSKSEMAYYYATAKVPDRLGCTFPQAARVDVKQLANKLDDI